MAEKDQYLTLENGVKCIFKAYGHKYVVNNKKLIGVSTILNMLHKEDLVNWKIREAIKNIKNALEKHLPDDKIQQVLDDAENKAKTKMTKILSIGKIVHSYIEKYVKGEKYIEPEDPVVLKCFQMTLYFGIDYFDVEYDINQKEYQHYQFANPIIYT